MRLAYLACRGTLDRGPGRRADAFEHDQMMACLEPAAAMHNGTVTAVAWDDAGADWAGFDGVLIGSCWDYQDRHDEFLAALERIGGAAPLFNRLDLVRWNSRKTYLRDLEAGGARTVPTAWTDRVGEAEVAAAFASFGTDRIVIKRQVGANAEGQFLLARGEPLPPMAEPRMIQPFLPAIASEGELSFVFVDGAFSHALLKRPAASDYRVQSDYGGREQPLSPSPADREAAAAVLAALGEAPLYARVDMVRGADGELMLMELELIEPFLFPLQGAELGDRLVTAIERRLSVSA